PADPRDLPASPTRRSSDLADQLAWLADNLDEGGVRWNILGNPVVLAGVNVGTDDDQFYLDTWDGYVLERRRVTELLAAVDNPIRSEEHTSELQSRFDLVCR